ncbi:hypothetical protein B296_00017207 [Ensete ventricosum]|uniref:RIN4 pathogenic type III effector avirulence factor Avr cleavage site domain-containing protein n=1 Tax=Ensete ventricosum TaxID=4639 RepID=A0A426ZJI5_ENSVE|nr:hypothetical protein B296_00017207 [Ensete ventricosum]
MVFYASVFTSFPTPPSHSIPNLSSPVSGEEAKSACKVERRRLRRFPGFALWLEESKLRMAVSQPTSRVNQDASEDVLHTRRSQLDVKNRVLKVSAKNSEAYAHDGQEPVKVSLNIEASKPSEVPSFQEMKPASKKDGIRQVGTSPVRNQDAAHRHENETKLTEKDVNTSSQEKGFSSDGTTRKTRKKRRKQGYGNPARDVIVPPFADWEINPESAEKYTDVFKIIGDSRKFPGV